MPFITQDKTNIKYILIVVILAAIAGGWILGYCYLQRKDLETKVAELETRLPEIKRPEKLAEDETVDWKSYRNEEIGIEFKYPAGCGGLEVRRTPGEVGAQINIYGKWTPTLECPHIDVYAYTTDYEYSYMPDSFSELDLIDDGDVGHEKASGWLGLDCSDFKLRPCASFSVQGRKAISAYVLWYDMVGVSASKMVLIENPARQFAIITIFFSTGSEIRTKQVEASGLVREEIDYIKEIQEKVLQHASLGEYKYNQMLSTFRFLE